MCVTGWIQESKPDRLVSLSSTATLAYLRQSTPNQPETLTLTCERFATRLETGGGRRGEGVFVVYPKLCRSIGRKSNLDLGLKQ